MCPRGARLLAGSGGLLAPAELVCHCLLIEGAQGLVLVDTGFGLDDVRRPRQLGRLFGTVVRPVLDVGETAVSQLRALGFDPRDVRHMITTHLDLDHAGGLPDFPDAEVHLLGEELAAALHPALERARALRRRALGARPAVGSSTRAAVSSWLGFDSVRVLPGSDDEILLIPLRRAHASGTPGSRSGRARAGCCTAGTPTSTTARCNAAALPAGARARSQPSTRSTAPRAGATSSACASSR